MQNSNAVVFFCHGSRNADWRVPFDALLAECRRRHPALRAELCFLELMQPDLPGTIDRLADAGVGQIRIVPLFLAPGQHTRRDLSAMLAAASARWPALEFELRDTLTEDPAMRERILDWASLPPEADAEPASGQPLLLDSIGRLASQRLDIEGALIVSGSHGGLSAAEYVIEQAQRPRLVAFNDAGIGRDKAGIAALAALDAHGLACVAYRHDSARIGDAADGLARGLLSCCNRIASEAGLRAGMSVREALAHVTSDSEPGARSS